MKKTIICLCMSLMLIVTLIPQISFAADTSNSNNIITGFETIENTDFYYEGNPEEEELTLNLPETLNVYLNNGTEATPISVSWEAVEDFENTDFYFYSMKPIWSSDYTLSPELSIIMDVPWITVYKQEPQNEEVEPMLTEEEIEPIYTEEDGPVVPDVTESSDTTGGIANSLSSLVVDEAYAATTAENTATIYNYLTGTMGLNTAAACGVMANINAESGMSPINLQNTYNSSFGLSDQEYTDRVNAGKGTYKTKSGTTKLFKKDRAGYGLCQWTSDTRKENLLNSATSGESSIGDINMQLAFFNSEIQRSYPQVYTTLKNVPNTAAGAYAAAAMFCLSYEVPANTINTAASRGKTCLSSYWKQYSGSSASVTGTSFSSLCGYSYPTAVKKGSGISVRGYAVSNYKISSITGKILNSSGSAVYSKTIKPSSTTAYRLSSLDDYMKFSKLSNGTYTYYVAMTDSLGQTVSARHTFKVSSSVSSSSALGFATAGVTSSSSTVTTPTATTYQGAYPTIPKRGYFKKGDKGTQVKRLQLMLNWCGYKVTTGGKYGSATIKAVKKLQKALKLKQDGKFGKKTLSKVKTIKK